MKQKHIVRKRMRSLAIVFAALLCVIVATPTLAASSSEAYALLYLVLPKTAQFFKPVEMESVDQGIEVQVVSAYIHDASASVVITVRDLEADRLDSSLDLYDSYEINTGFDSVGCCKQIDYDETTNTATFLITIESMDEADVIAGEKVTFSLTTLLGGKSELLDLPVAIDWDLIDSSPDTESADLYEPDDGNVLVPGKTIFTASEGFDVTGLGYVNGKLHVQLYTPGRKEYDDHAALYLKNAAGDTITGQSIYRGSYGLETDDRTDYIDYAFEINVDELTDYTLYGNFWRASNRIDGNWSVTFPLENDD